MLLYYSVVHTVLCLWPINWGWSLMAAPWPHTKEGSPFSFPSIFVMSSLLAASLGQSFLEPLTPLINGYIIYSICCPEDRHGQWCSSDNSLIALYLLLISGGRLPLHNVYFVQYDAPVSLWPCIRYNLKKGWIQEHILGKLADLEFENHKNVKKCIFCWDTKILLR